VVVRFGYLLYGDFIDSIQNEYAINERYGLSVSYGVGMTAAACVKRRRLPHPVYRSATVAALKQGGLAVVATDDKHALIMYATEPTVQDWVQLGEILSEAQANPYAAQRGERRSR
jgi:hypothetical protein